MTKLSDTYLCCVGLPDEVYAVRMIPARSLVSSGEMASMTPLMYAAWGALLTRFEVKVADKSGLDLHCLGWVYRLPA